MLGALAGLGVALGAGFGRAGRASWVGRGVWAWGLAVLGALAGLGVVSKYKSIPWKYKSRLSKCKSILSKYKNTFSNYTKYIYKYANIL